MKPMTAAENNARNYYDDMWSDPTVIRRGGDELILGCHYGLYEKGIKTKRDAILNMNDFVGRLLGLDSEKPIEILDAGCGVGGTSIYLAMKYPRLHVTGVTIAANEITLAEKLRIEKKITNARFIQGTYTNTGLPDSSFDGAFALESVNYTPNKQDFVREMHRVLKPGGKLVVIDGFWTGKPLTIVTQKIYDRCKKERGSPELSTLSTFTAYVKKEGFEEITITYLTKQVRRNFLILSFERLPSMVKGMIKRNDEALAKGIGYFPLDFIIGLSNIDEYAAVTATKI